MARFEPRPFFVSHRVKGEIRDSPYEVIYIKSRPLRIPFTKVDLSSTLENERVGLDMNTYTNYVPFFAQSLIIATDEILRRIVNSFSHSQNLT